MARGPYQGTWQSGIRPTVVQAPDAVVFINGETDMLGCNECRRRFNWNKYITSIQVDLNVDSAPGTAAINLSIPRHSIDDFYFDGNPLITSMMEVEIFAKGYFTVEGLPQYYPIFWGLITEVTESYSGGEHTLSISCSDILKWWELCKMNINPALTAKAGQAGRSIFGNVFFGANPYDVIWTLAQQAFGDVVVGSGSLVSLHKEAQQRETFSRGLSSIMLYWQERFSKIRSNLLLYGTSGTAVRGDTLYQQYQTSLNRKTDANMEHFASTAVRNANGGGEGGQTVFDPTDPGVVAFRTQFNQAGQVNFWTSEYQTKLELANAAKECIGFEFYMDVTGDIVFKPPFYNLDILSNKPVSWIQDIDIITWDWTDSEAEVVTQVQMQGSFGGSVDYGFPEEATPYTSVTDYHLLRKYGWRTQTFNSEFMGSPLLMFYTGMDILDRFNARRYHGSVTIPMRPELRLGFPIYVASKDQIWYVQGISHNIQFGGQAQTTLLLTAKRSKFVAPKGIGSIRLSGTKGAGKESESSSQRILTSRQLQKCNFEANVDNAAQIPEVNPGTTPDNDPYTPVELRHPKTGRILGWPNVVMAYSRPFQDPPKESLYRVSGQKLDPSGSSVINTQKEINKEGANQVEAVAKTAATANANDALREKHLSNRYTYGLNSAGVFVYLHDTSQVIQEMLILPGTNITYTGSQTDLLEKPKASGLIRPVSDERGFEVVGHWRYGRGVSLRDGSLVVDPQNPNATNSRASVQTQIALTGDLLTSLKAQSAGLSTIKTKYEDPALTIATLAPDDLQTAGVINPDTGEPEFVPGKTNFVDVAPLGSPEQQKVGVNVEATQLSRALTLAELSVREESLGNADCACVMGRPDLAFINVGYQVKTLRSTAEDDTSISFGAEAIPLGEQPPDADLVGLAAALRDGRPVTPSQMVISTGKLTSRVDLFLSNLYSALDASHKDYEKAIRGDTLIKNNPTDLPPDRVRFPNSDTSGFEPPFSSPGRARGGDPTALGQQGSSARDALAETWNSFGDRLEAAQQRARLEGEINDLERRIAELVAEAGTLMQEGTDPPKVKVNAVGDGSVGNSERLRQIEEQLAELRQQLLNKQHELNVLNQEFPP